MKNLKIVLILVCFSVMFLVTDVISQTNYNMDHGIHTVYQMYEDAMTDSVGNYYHQFDASGNYISLDKYTNTSRFLPIWIKHSSTAGAVSITSTLEGRIYNQASGAWETWYTIDTLAAASSTETAQEILVGLAGNERPQQIRIKFDGQSGNRVDTKIYSWINLLKDRK